MFAITVAFISMSKLYLLHRNSDLDDTKRLYENQMMM